ncbi:MAG: YitT family protein [Lachnospiraceae bacterium]|nr:YitT family protein [Lachnospiraceae bacterium]
MRQASDGWLRTEDGRVNCEEIVVKNVSKTGIARIRRGIRKYSIITLASVVYAAGVSLFLDPNNLAPGGVTGISIIVNRLTGVPTGTMIFLINIPLILLGLWKFGWKFILSTGYAVLAVSVATDLMAPIGALTEEPMLACLTGGTLVALALGIIFRQGATTGGTDIIVKVLRLSYPHLRTGALFFLTDVIIVMCSGLIFRNIDVVLYAMIAVIVMSVVMDVVLYGRDEAKLIYIISDSHEEIAGRLLEEIDIGVTYLRGEGGYSSRDKKVIMCVTKKQQAPKIEEVVKEEDPRAFMIVTSATEIFGEGYKSIFADRL